MELNLCNKKKRGRMLDLCKYRKEIMYNLFNENAKKIRE